jgi:ribosomal protein S18 acetylase RimI-like enzyme
MINIRKANTNDLQEILPMWIELMEYHESRNMIFKTNSNVEEIVLNDITELIQKPNVILFVAEINSELVGFSLTAISTRPQVFSYKRKGHIGETYVKEKFRSKGVGKELIIFIKSFLKNENVDFIDLQVTITNETGKRFWERNGFKIVNYYMVNNLQNTTDF